MACFHGGQVYFPKDRFEKAQRKNAHRLIIFGPPGAGKWTQAPNLVKSLGLKWLKTGNLLRQAVADKTPFGTKARRFMNSGKPVPDYIVLGVLEESIEDSGDNGFLLEGFPRTVAQAEALDELLGDHKLTGIVNLLIPNEKLEERICGRRVHRASGRRYHIKFKQPHDEGKDDITHEPLEQQEKDTPEAVKVRIEKFDTEAKQVLDYYADSGIVMNISADVEPDEVWHRICKPLKIYQDKKLLIIGPPGAGKHTQAEKLKNLLNGEFISTGDLLRDAVNKGTPLGLKAQNQMASGELVDDLVVIGIVKETLEKIQGPFILEGFPRTVKQAEALEKDLGGHGLTDVINMKIPFNVLEERVTGRRVHPASGRTYHVKYNPPLRPGVDNETGESLVVRQDDTPANLKTRLENFSRQVDQVLYYYEDKGVVREVDAYCNTQQAFERIRVAIHA